MGQMKKIAWAILALALAACLGGCALLDTVKQAMEKGGRGESTEESETSMLGRQNPDEKGEEGSPADPARDWFLDNAATNELIVLDEEGKPLKTIGTDELIEEYIGTGSGYGYKEEIGNRRIYYCIANADYSTAVYMYDVDKETMEFLMETNESVTLTEVDDQLYVELGIYEEGLYRYEFYRYKKEGQEYSLEPVYDKLREMMAQKGMNSQTRYSGNYTQYTTAYCVEKYGKAVYGMDDRLGLFSRDGKMLDEIRTPGSMQYLNLKGFDGRYIVYGIYQYEEYTGGEGIWVYDTQKRQKVAVHPEETSGYTMEVFDFYDGVIYYGVIKEESSKRRSCDLYAYDIEKAESRYIITEETRPGHTLLWEPFYSGFKVIEDTVYYLAEGDGVTEWITCTRKGDGWERDRLGSVVQAYGYADYGTIEARETSEKCPQCGIQIYSSYYEHLIMDPSLSHADRMNEILQAEAEAFQAEVLQDTQEALANVNCQELHTDEEFYASGKREETVKDVRRVRDRYLSIERGVYWVPYDMWEGIYYDYSVMLDLETGEKVTLKELYKGTEKELKERVASKAAEEYWNLSDVVSAQSSEELYQAVYEAVSLDFDTVIFKEDRVTFQFTSEYDFSYYNGLEIDLSYEELGL